MHILLSKKVVLALIALAVLTTIISFTFNACLVSKIVKVIPKWQQHPVVPRESASRFQAHVRVVPLLSTNDSDISPKYKYFREQGLHPKQQFPSALIIGVKKGGTRAMIEFIRIHPDVRAAGGEIHFFDVKYFLGLEWYRKQMPPSLEGQVTLEKTPAYYVTVEAPRRIQQMNPSIRLIVVVRDPVVRAISDYAQISSKKPDMKPFNEMVFVNSSDGMIVNTNWRPVKIGIYARHLERWLQYFPLSQLLFVSGERLVLDPAFELKRVQDFLGLKRVITERHFYFNSTKKFPCLYKSEAHSYHCLSETKGRAHPFVESEVIQRLRDFYRPFNNRFYQMTGINFGWA